MTPDREVTLKDVYELVDGVRYELKGDIGECKKSIEEYKALAANGRVDCENRFGCIEKTVEVVNTRVYYAFAGILALFTVLGYILVKLMGG